VAQFWWVLLICVASSSPCCRSSPPGLDLTGRIPGSPTIRQPDCGRRGCQRPASVVKELVENAIDAGATRVGITIEQGGKRLVRIEDDGVGMDAADAELAVERHATSKIRSKDDLDAIETLGFRGEALPSIASVSRFSLRTRQQGEMAGTEVLVEGGAIVAVRAAGTPPGTVIDVADLFFNLPARRKFLKADSAESAQISRLVTQFALGYPDVGFTFTSNGRKVLQCPPAGSARERFFQVFGERPDLVEVSREVGSSMCSGCRARPKTADAEAAVAVRTAGSSAIAASSTRSRWPTPATIKTQPRGAPVEMPDGFRTCTRPRPRCGSSSVARTRGHPSRGRRRPRGPAPARRPVLAHATRATARRARCAVAATRLESVRHHAASFVARGAVRSGTAGTVARRACRRPGRRRRADPAGRSGDCRREASAGDVMRLPDIAEAIVSAQQAVVDATRPMVRRQFRDTYIIAVDADGILIIDQHVAHERVLYEDISARLMGGTLPQQPLLTPLVLDLTAAQCEALESHRAILETLGVEFEEFGGHSVRLTAMPAMLGINDVAATVLALADDLEGLGRGGRIEDTLKHMAATMACHAAVKANMKLPLEKMQFLMDELRRTAYSSVCPHGRPVVLRLTRREIEKNFQRI
jgi:DNA mismatch repair protein MutL